MMQIKQGDTFLLALSVSVDGLPQDLTNWKVRSWLSSISGMVMEFTVDFTDRTAGEFNLEADTASWPIGWLGFDIRYTTDSEQIVTTKSIPVLVLRSDTQ